MRPLELLLVFHNHQPDGNFGEVFQQAYEDCYGPLLDALAAHPHVKVGLHHTGALLEWIEHNRPAYFTTLRGLVARGQVELLGGGFYEPMLAVLPERDARGQIALMSDYLEEKLGARPTGMWLAERVWEPHLAQLIAETGLRYTLVDDGHFRAAGMDGLLRGYYVTEKAGTPLAILPIDQRLRQAVPFMHAHETMDVLERLRQETPAELPCTVTYGDDGEKFGVWPKTKEWVWGQGWLRRFFELLGERRDRVTTVLPGELIAARPPSGRVYLPTASYEEMGEWALPAPAQARYNALRHGLEARGELEPARPFVRGGIWQNFLAKYPEANFMHKKMVWVSDKLARAEEKAGPSALAGARRELYRAQCNCCYWHGLFGGLYLNYLRDAVYRHLIEAEVQADAVLGAPSAPTAEVRDLDADLRPEVLLTNDRLAAYVKPDQGGGVFELDFRPKRFNLLNVLGRRPEGYHGKLRDAATAGHGEGGGQGVQSIHDLVALKSAGLDALLVYDRHPRFAFIDHFLGHDDLRAIASGRLEERGDFAGAPYDVIESGQGRVRLRRHGNVEGRAVTIDKTLSLDGGRLTARYRLTAEGEPFQATFAPELSLTLLAGDAPDRYYRVPGRELSPEERRLAAVGSHVGAAIELVNEWDRFVVRVEAEGAQVIHRYPIETASQSEGGFERTYQGSVLLPVFAVRLGGGAPVEIGISITCEERPA